MRTAAYVNGLVFEIVGREQRARNEGGRAIGTRLHRAALSDEVVEVELEDLAADERLDLATSSGCVQRIGDQRRGHGLVCLGLNSRFRGHDDHETVPHGTD